MLRWLIPTPNGSSRETLTTLISTSRQLHLSPPPPPKTVLALLDEIDRLKAENDALRGAVEQLAEMLNSIHVPIDLNEILKGAKQ
ncbi:TPA: hypothetical protein L4E73_003310 [Pseudomonas aeruginosa]|nr:hypothetical protein [Pseudomonas aeruginosa]